MFNDSLRSQILDGTLQDSKDFLRGKYKGFYVTIQQDEQTYIIKINASSSFDENNVQLGSFLEKQKELSRRIIDGAVYEHCLVLSVQGPALKKNAPEILNEVIQPIINHLTLNHYNSGCEYCGSSETELNCYEINSAPYYMCETCKNEVHTALQENQEAVSSRKSNLIGGLVGAFLGSLIGCVLWVIIYRLGFIAGIAGAVTAVCAMKGYELLGGHLDKKGVIGSVIIMVVMIYFANRIAWCWDAYDALKDYDWTFSEISYYFYGILIDSELVVDYLKDLAIGYVLTILASYKNIIGAFKASTGSYKIEKSN